MEMLSPTRMMESYLLWHGKNLVRGWVRTVPYESGAEYEYSRPYLAQVREEYREFCRYAFGEYVVIQVRRRASKTLWQKFKRFFTKDYGARITVLGSFDSKAEAELACAAVGIEARDKPVGCHEEDVFDAPEGWERC